MMLPLVPDSVRIPPTPTWPGQAWGLSLAARRDRREQGMAPLALVEAAAEIPRRGGGVGGVWELSCLSRLVGDSWGICFRPDGQQQPG